MFPCCYSLVILRFQKLPNGWCRSHCFHALANIEAKSHAHYKTQFSLDDKADHQMIRLEKTDFVLDSLQGHSGRIHHLIQSNSVMFCFKKPTTGPTYYSLRCPMKQKQLSFCCCYDNWHFSLSTQRAQTPMKDIEST